MKSLILCVPMIVRYMGSSRTCRVKEGGFVYVGILTHHRVVMHVRANPSEVFVSYSFERRGMSCERSDGFCTPREYGIGIFEGGG